MMDHGSDSYSDSYKHASAQVAPLHIGNSPLLTQDTFPSFTQSFETTTPLPPSPILTPVDEDMVMDLDLPQREVKDTFEAVQEPYRPRLPQIPQSSTTLPLDDESEPALGDFNNFLRAFYPFPAGSADTASSSSSSASSSSVTLTFERGDVILVHSIHPNGWADGTSLRSGARGWLPTNYCQVYDEGPMVYLLKALMDFWDLLQSGFETNLGAHQDQLYTRGMISGVKYLLESTGCITRDSPAIKAHSGLKKTRKYLLADLSSLVKTAKHLHIMATEGVNQTDIEDTVDDMLLRAFKIILRGSTFLDVWIEDIASGPAQDTYPANADSSRTTPISRRVSAGRSSRQTQRASSGTGIQGGAGSAFPSRHGSRRTSGFRVAAGRMEQTSGYTSQRSSLGPSNVQTPFTRPGTAASTRRRSRPSSVQPVRQSIIHRASYYCQHDRAKNVNLVSSRLSTSHDTLLTNLASFSGRLHLQSQSVSGLLITTTTSVDSAKELLSVIEAVAGRSQPQARVLEEVREALYQQIHEMVLATQSILDQQSVTEDGDDVMLSASSMELEEAITACVRTAGECVARTKFAIERLGDFLIEPSAGYSEAEVQPVFMRDGTHLSPEPPWDDLTPQPSRLSRRSVQVATPEPTYQPPAPPMSPEREDKRLPQIEEPYPSTTMDMPMVDIVSPVGGVFSPSTESLVLLPRIRTDLSISGSYLADASCSTDSLAPELAGTRAGGYGTSSAGTESSYNDSMRDSETSLLSRTSTRATTPDHLDPSSGPYHAPSISTSCSTLMEDIEETESKLLERTHAHELMTNKDGQVTGGTLPALIERLTTPDTPPDGQFVSTFYLTFRLFTTPTNFAQALIDRWDNVEQSPLTSLPVRLRVYNVLKGWMESHWRNDCDGVALKMIHTFAKRMVLPGLYGPANKIFDLVEKVVGTEETLVPRLVSSMGKTNTSSARYVSPDTPNPTPHITTKQLAILKSWKAGLGQPCILDFEPIELARQFTLQQSRRFCTILPEELLGCEWMNKSSSIAKNVRENIKLSTNLTTLVTDSVLGPEDPKKRAVIIKQWIKVGMKCLELKNYDSVLAIVCALDSSIVQRLRKTWEAISTNKKGHFDTLRKLTNVDHNRQALRQALRDEIPPCIPFVGMYLTDLAFTDYGNQSTRELHGPAPRPGHGPATQNLEVINFDKHMKTAKIIGDLQRFQIPYRLAEVPDLADWIADNLDRLAGDAGPEDSSRTQEYYRRSLALEPRDSGSRGATKMVSPVLEQGTFPIAAPMIKGGFDFRAWTQSLGRDRSGADVAAS